jgi:NTP pyrophosphatase (non-canonical NTP hydrolase)
MMNDNEDREIEYLPGDHGLPSFKNLIPPPKMMPPKKKGETWQPVDILSWFVEGAVKTESMDFEKIAERFSNPSFIRIFHGVMGLVTETGELMDQLKKYGFYGKDLDYINLGEELGDLLWYAAVISDELEKLTGHDFAEWLRRNHDKLEARYGGQKFAETRALDRDLDKEREILEAKDE